MEDDSSKVFAMEPRCRATLEQFHTIIDFMERNHDLSRPSLGPQSRLENDQLWIQLTKKLNSLGGGVQRSTDKWKKVWADWKTKTKKKYLNLRDNANEPGFQMRPLTTLERRVIGVMKIPAPLRQSSTRDQSFNIISCEPIQETESVEMPLEQDNTSDEYCEYYESETEDHSDNVPAATPKTPIIIIRKQPKKEYRQTRPRVVTEYIKSPSPTPWESPLPSPPRRQTTSPVRKVTVKAQRNRGMTPFERAAEQFAAVEKRRLDFEEARDKRLHEQEMERLRLDAERIEVAREQNSLLHQLSFLGQSLIDVIANKQRTERSPSTDATL